MSKKRLDIILVEKGLFDSRERAKSAVMAGSVFVDGQKADKPGVNYDESIIPEIRENSNPYVSRGGLKIEKAIRDFGIRLNGKTTLDVGASTGGFTDCMLENGASKVYAIDVGYGQLAWKLRQDERVVCMERTNIRNVTNQDICEPADFASIDVSFISLKKVLPVVYKLLSDNGEILCLVKPQFEAGREKVGKKGVVRKSEVHEEVLTDISNFAVNSGFQIIDLGFSPIKGPQGNIEFLLYLKKLEKDGNDSIDFSQYAKRIARTVKAAHEMLD